MRNILKMVDRRGLGLLIWVTFHVRSFEFSFGSFALWNFNMGVNGKIMKCAIS